MRRTAPKVLSSAVLLGLSLLLSSCGGADSATQMTPTDEVAMTADQMFDPQGASVAAGSTVTFTNTSSEAHTVTAYENEIPEGAEYFASGGFNSEVNARKDIAGGLLREGDTYEVTLTEPGTYRYFCVPHEGAGMKGTLVVEE